MFTSSYEKFWSKNCALLHLITFITKRGKELGEGERKKEREGGREKDRQSQTDLSSKPKINI